jgi:DNA-directed RNA polymerase specialized sigma24 family protein
LNRRTAAVPSTTPGTTPGTIPGTTPGYDADSYLATLVTEVNRRVVFIKGLSPSQRDDVCQMTLLYFWLDEASIRARYPQPGVWAGLKLRTVAVDFGRREGAQRGEGARHTRQVGTVDTTDSTWQEMFSIDCDPLERLQDSDELAPLFAILNPEDRTLVYLVHGLGYTNRDAAGLLGITDSCASRRLRSAMARMHAFGLAA